MPEVEVRTKNDDGSWSAWRALTFEVADSESGVDGRLMAELLWVKRGRSLDYRIVAAPASAKLDISFINTAGDATGTDRVVGALRTVVAAISGVPLVPAASAAPAMPKIMTRREWGANERWRDGEPDYALVKMAFVHHTVSGNNYTRQGGAGVVRAVYWYHTQSAGFRDIGYNFLIDKYGQIYEGRYGGIREGVIGAQTLGFNTSSTGVALVGTFSSVSPPPAMLGSLRALLAWKLDVHHINPLSKAKMLCRASDRFRAGTTVWLPAISAHRTACYTACPGNGMYARMAWLRKAVTARGLPKIYAFSVSPAALSPTGDGVRDTVSVRYTISEAASWTVVVSDAVGMPVRSFGGQGATAVKVVWDGRDDQGAVVPDGTYVITGSAQAPSGRKASPGVQAVVVDTVSPEFEQLRQSSAVVNPLGTGAGDRVAVSYVLNEPCSVRAVVRSATGETVRELTGMSSLHQGPRSVTWDGKIVSDGRTVSAPEGMYTIVVLASDAAGNTGSASAEVRVDRTVRVTGTQPIYFSPNGDGQQDIATVPFTLLRAADVVATVKLGSTAVRSMPMGRLEAGAHSLDWDGTRADGTVVSSGGLYTVVFEATGDAIESRAAGRVIVDRRGPYFKLGAGVTVRRSTTARMYYAVYDQRSPRAHVTVVVRRSGVVAKRQNLGCLRTGTRLRFSYTPPKAGVYVATFTAVDLAGNRQQTPAYWRVNSR
jgi:flagellar hook assembly protein FlgD